MVKRKGTFLKIEEEVKKIGFEGDKDNGMVMTLIIMTETIGVGMGMDKTIPIDAEDGEVTEVRATMTGAEGIQIHITHNMNIHYSPNILTPIITGHCQWATNISIPYHMSNALLTLKPNHSTHHLDCQHNHGKLQTYVNCAKSRVIMITNANSQVILWPIHKNPLTKVIHTTIRTPIMVNGPMQKMTTMIPIVNLFSKVGSCFR